MNDSLFAFGKVILQKPSLVFLQLSLSFLCPYLESLSLLGFNTDLEKKKWKNFWDLGALEKPIPSEEHK